MPWQTHAAAPAAGDRTLGERRGQSTPATLNTRTAGRSVRSSARCHSAQVAASPASSTEVGGVEHVLERANERSRSRAGARASAVAKARTVRSPAST